MFEGRPHAATSEKPKGEQNIEFSPAFDRIRNDAIEKVKQSMTLSKEDSPNGPDLPMYKKALALLENDPYVITIAERNAWERSLEGASIPAGMEEQIRDELMNSAFSDAQHSLN